MRKNIFDKLVSISSIIMTIAVLISVLINCAGSNKSVQHDDDVYGSRAYSYFLEGNMPSAIDTYKKGYAKARKTDNYQGSARYLSNIGRVFYEMGVIDSAVLYHKKAYEEFRMIGDDNHASTAAAFLALSLATSGDESQSREWLKTAASANNRKDSEHYLAIISAMINYRLTEKITNENAVDNALTYYKKNKDYRMLSTIYILKADVEISKGNNTTAINYLNEALTIIDKSQELYKRSRILLKLAKIKFDSGDDNAGRHYYERAVDCAPRGVVVPSGF